MSIYWEMVGGYYTERCSRRTTRGVSAAVGLASSLSANAHDLPNGSVNEFNRGATRINSHPVGLRNYGVLAGELEGGWKVRWRMKLFFWLVKLQMRWQLVPRISFSSQPDSPSPAPSTSTVEKAEAVHHL